MRVRLLFLIVIISFVSCQDDEQIEELQNLQAYIDVNSQNPLDEVIACAASNSDDPAISYVFYYPVIGATDIRYYESEILNIDPNDLSLYKRKELTKESVFGGKLERFVRGGLEEAWCVVTFKLQGTLHISNPIRLKNSTKPSEWINTVAIDLSQSGSPKFSWNDGTIAENAIYFQVITNAQDDFLSGTYTYEKCFQYRNMANVVLNINTMTPPDLEVGQDYNFVLMGVSEDNWVNLVVQNTFTAQ
ncbi:hypothetical protein RQM59_00405 [Flavobacteriaceae bacterium S356]|uniref:Uncharacterized protein n=1 Tax=Asprobacillus argus TaxID=3076534 RepID=A0ABU3LCM5_9FLAO|nr:hypothetical protein [Flavobacteriaceae bacterium S356]